MRGRKGKRWLALLLGLVVALGLGGCQVAEEILEEAASWEQGAAATESAGEIRVYREESKKPVGDVEVAEDGTYDSKEEVAAYLHLYGKLPSNYITKKEAQALGWEGGSLERFAPGKCIGGSHYGNYEGNLPEKKGRSYKECDIDTLGKSKRGAKRIIFSNDGLIYYTEDHYTSFTLLYGEE